MNIMALEKWIPGLTRPLIIAGPCSAESEEQVLATAHEIKQKGNVTIFRAGAWKPRTRPYTFEGHGEEALAWIERAGKETGLMTTTEVATPEHAELALKYNIDILWIGARTTANPFSVQAIADVLKGVNIPVMVKNPINADLALWIGALERFEGAGIHKLAAIHRGFSSAEKSSYRNLPMWRIPIELKRRYPNLPVICDPSHITGKREMVGMVCQKAIDVDMDGLMVETHLDPEKALSDADQQVTPQMLADIVDNLQMKSEFSSDRGFETELEEMRSGIDRLDRELIELLAQRQKIVEKIGESKARNNVTVLQIHRMDQLLEERLRLGALGGLDEKYTRDIFETIHEESVRVQSDIVDNWKKS